MALREQRAAPGHRARAPREPRRVGDRLSVARRLSQRLRSRPAPLLGPCTRVTLQSSRRSGGARGVPLGSRRHSVSARCVLIARGACDCLRAWPLAPTAGLCSIRSRVARRRRLLQGLRCGRQGRTRRRAGGRVLSGRREDAGALEWWGGGPTCTSRPAPTRGQMPPLGAVPLPRDVRQPARQVSQSDSAEGAPCSAVGLSPYETGAQSTCSPSRACSSAQLCAYKLWYTQGGASSSTEHAVNSDVFRR